MGEAWIFILIILIFSAIFHEYAHGFAAYTLGDPTAKNMGRLTLNPVPHIDPFFTILLPAMMIIMPGINFIIGGAKPVPVNPLNLKGKHDHLKVALSGPASNIALAILFGLCIRFIPLIRQDDSLFLAFGAVVFVNLLLAVFNLLPIPPLDGSYLLFTLFPGISRQVKMFFSQYGFFILLGALILFAPFIFTIILTIINLLFNAITGISFLNFFNLLG